MTVTVGQIWKEVDPRKLRFVRVTNVSPDGSSIKLETLVHAGGTKWVRAAGTRDNYAKADRFDGKYGGYALHVDVDGTMTGSGDAPVPKAPRGKRR